MRQFIDRHFRGNSFSPKRVTPILTPFLSRVSTDRFGHQRTLKPRKSRCFHSIDGRLWTFSEGGVGAAEVFEPGNSLQGMFWPGMFHHSHPSPLIGVVM